MPSLTLKNLEDKKIVTLSHGFGGSNTMDMEFSLSNIFLENVEFINNHTALKLSCKTIKGSEVTGYIRSENSELLEEIKNEVEKFKNKSISSVYSAKLDIELDI